MATDNPGRQLNIIRDVSPDDYTYVCRHLFDHNVVATEGLVKQPGIDVKLILKDGGGQVMGGIFCDTFLKCLYIDVLWVDERCRDSGFGRALLTEAEQIAQEHGCTFAHTTTFSYQAPEFYQRLGYRIFGVIDDYPDGTKQYFLKKPL